MPDDSGPRYSVAELVDLGYEFRNIRMVRRADHAAAFTWTAEVWKDGKQVKVGGYDRPNTCGILTGLKRD